MAASMAGALKAYIEGLGLHVPVYRDGAPLAKTGDVLPATSYPFMVVQEGIAYDLDFSGDYADPDDAGTLREQVQLDLYQLARSLTGTPAPGPGRTVVTERYDLPDLLTAALRRASRAGLQDHSPWRVYGVNNIRLQRWPVSDNLLRHTWNIVVARSVERIAA